MRDSSDRLDCHGQPACPRQNSLLAALPDEDYQRLAPYLQGVDLEAGQVLGAQSSRIPYVYFPVSALLSLHYVQEDGSGPEIASIGHEGVFGVSLLTSDAGIAGQAQVQIAGRAYRGAAEHVSREFARGTLFQRLVLRHVQTLFMQVAQTATCNRSHSVQQRLCRCLLGMLERGPVEELVATHERLADILGVRRESITAIAGLLQAEGAIRYRRGRICVLAPRELELRSCGCRSVLKQLYERSLNMQGLLPRSGALRLASV